MNTFRTLLVLLAALGMPPVANAQWEIDCACDGNFHVGAPVIMLNDTGPGPGATGRVVAGRDDYKPLLIEWDDWYEGMDGGMYVACPPYYPHGNSRQWVKCSEVALVEDHDGERIWCACFSKYEVGQRVRARFDLHDDLRTGSLGTLVGGVATDEDGRLLVEWDDFYGGHGGGGESNCPPVPEEGCGRLWVPCWAVLDQDFPREIDCACDSRFECGDFVYQWINWGDYDREVRYGTALAGDPWGDPGMIAVAFRDFVFGGGIQDGSLLCPPIEDRDDDDVEWVECEPWYGIEEYELGVLEHSEYGCPCDKYFQAGDRVVNIGNYGTGPSLGEYGTVVSGSVWYGAEQLLVAWDEFSNGHNGLRPNMLCPQIELSGNNRWFVSLSSVASPRENCPCDVNQDGMVDGGDLTHVLAYWGPCSCHETGENICHADVNSDGAVDGADITHLLAAWGACN